MTRARPTRLTPVKRQEFLAAIAAGLTVKEAAEKIGANRQVMYERKKKDARLSADWDAAYAAGTDVLEAVARQRATEGTIKPVYQRGQLVGGIREYSDTLTIFLLKARDPQRFRDRLTVDGHQSHTHEGKFTIADLVGRSTVGEGKTPAD